MAKKKKRVLGMKVVDDGTVELSFQKRSDNQRRVVENFPSAKIPEIGVEIGFTDTGEKFAITEIRHLLVPGPKNTLRPAVLIMIDEIQHA